MKTFSVLCLQKPFAFDKLLTVRVNAENKESAKAVALNTLRKTYPDAVVAPEIPGAQVVMEIE